MARTGKGKFKKGSRDALNYFCNSCCIIMSLQAGCTVVCAILITIAMCGLSVNFPFIHLNPESAVLLTWVFLLLLTAAVGLTAAYKENRILAAFTCFLLIVTIGVWAAASIIPYVKPKTSWVKQVCIDYRCGESMWLVEQHWRDPYAKQGKNIADPPEHLREGYSERSHRIEERHVPLMDRLRNSSNISGAENKLSSLLSEGHTKNKTTLERFSDNILSELSTVINRNGQRSINTSVSDTLNSSIISILNRTLRIHKVTRLNESTNDTLLSSSKQNSEISEISLSKPRQKRAKSQIKDSDLNREPKRFMYYYYRVYYNTLGNELWSIMMFVASGVFLLYCLMLFIVFFFWLSNKFPCDAFY